MLFLKRLSIALPALAALVAAACATAPDPLLTCNQEETNQWGRQNVIAISKGGPIRPLSGLDANAAGTVTMAVDFLSSGSAHTVTLVESSGHAGLDEAAMKRLREADLTTPVCSGRSSSVRVLMPMAFDVKER